MTDDLILRFGELDALVSADLKFPRRARELVSELAGYARRLGGCVPADEAASAAAHGTMPVPAAVIGSRPTCAAGVQGNNKKE